MFKTQCNRHFPLVVQIADLANEDTPQLYVACGRGPRSSLRVLRHGLEVRWEFLGSLNGVKGRPAQNIIQTSFSEGKDKLPFL